jgi:DNA-directed RNA polymerase specialized sigma subunit
LARGEATLIEIGRTYNVSHMTISRLKNRAETV